jgi:acetyltransferase-like isoleucine patch superfamily enzyme
MAENTASLAPAEIEIPVEARPSALLLLKRLVQGCFSLIVLPRLIAYWMSRTLLGPRAFGAASESIARIPGMRGVYSRQAFYRRTLSRCGQDCSFGWMSVFSMTDARVGDRVYIGRFCSIGLADIGDEAMLADGVQILSGGREHTRDDAQAAMQSQRQVYRKVSIGTGSWIGAGAIIMADVGEHAIVGAGAVVNRPVASFSVAAGVPAKIVKELPRSGSHE